MPGPFTLVGSEEHWLGFQNRESDLLPPEGSPAAELIALKYPDRKVFYKSIVSSTRGWTVNIAHTWYLIDPNLVDFTRIESVSSSRCTPDGEFFDEGWSKPLWYVVSRKDRRIFPMPSKTEALLKEWADAQPMTGKRIARLYTLLDWNVVTPQRVAEAVNKFEEEQWQKLKFSWPEFENAMLDLYKSQITAEQKTAKEQNKPMGIFGQRDTVFEKKLEETTGKLLREVALSRGVATPDKIWGEWVRAGNDAAKAFSNEIIKGVNEEIKRVATPSISARTCTSEYDYPPTKGAYELIHKGHSSVRIYPTELYDESLNPIPLLPEDHVQYGAPHTLFIKRNFKAVMCWKLLGSYMFENRAELNEWVEAKRKGIVVDRLEKRRRKT